MRDFLFFISCYLLLSSNLVCGHCPKNGRSIDGSCYFGINVNETFSEAKAFCDTYFYGNLASITSAVDDSNVLDLARGFFKDAKNVWLGGTYDGSKIQWLDGSPDVYRNFAAGTQPGKIVLNLVNGNWSTATWNAILPFICLEKEEPITTPTLPLTTTPKTVPPITNPPPATCQGSKQKFFAAAWIEFDLACSRISNFVFASNAVLFFSFPVLSASISQSRASSSKPTITTTPTLPLTTAPKTVPPITNPPPPTCPKESPCPPEWVYSSTLQSCYKVIYGLNFQQAADQCTSMSSTLASIRSDEENRVVNEVLKLGIPLTTWAQGGLLGAKRTGAGVSEWMWIDGSPWNYTKWARGEPNNVSGGEFCIETYTDNPSMLEDSTSDIQKWNDSDCELTWRAAICKRKSAF